MLEDTYYLVENYDPKIDYTNASVIALSPQSCYDLDKNKIKYSIIDEFYREEDLRKDADNHFFEQLKWFAEFDNFLKANIEFCSRNKIDLATSHYNQIKYFIDTILIASYILNSFIEKAKPRKIVLVSNTLSEPPDNSIYSILHSKTLLLVRLLPFACKQHNIAFETLTQSNTVLPVKKINCCNLKLKIKHLLIKLQFKSFLNFIKFKKYLKLVKSIKGKEKLNVLILHAGCRSIDSVIGELFQAGERIFTISPQGIVKENILFQKTVVRFNAKVKAGNYEQINSQCNNAAKKLKNQTYLLEWINKECSMDVSAIVLPYLEHFISHISSQDIPKIEKLLRFYKEEGIEMLISRASSGLDTAYCLAAAKKIEGLKKICFQHSATALDGRLLQMTELAFFDFYVTTEGFSEKYFNAYRQQLDIFKHCRVLQSSHYLKYLKNNKKKEFPKGEKEIIIFAPCDGFSGVFNFNNEYYYGAWYFQFLRKLVDYFAERSDKSFIYKCPPSSKWKENPIVAYIRDKNAGNITLEHRPLIQCFNMGHRVLLDYPSTGLFESATVGMPVMSLYRKNFKMWEDALVYFGKSLQPFNQAEDAIERINNFLNQKREDYLVNIPLLDKSILEVLYSTTV